MRDGTTSSPETDGWIDFGDVVARCLGNQDLAKRVVGRFQGGLEDTLRQLNLLAEQGEWNQVAKRVHRLKGEAGNVGCRSLMELAGRVEEVCDRGQVAPARSSLDELARACEVVQRQAL